MTPPALYGTFTAGKEYLGRFVIIDDCSNFFKLEYRYLILFIVEHLERMVVQFNGLINQFISSQEHLIYSTCGRSAFRYDVEFAVLHLLRRPQHVKGIGYERDVKLFGKIEKIFQEAGLEPMGKVDESLPFDPRLHQRMSGGELREGDQVRVRFVGYRFGENIVTKAMVSRRE